MKIEWNIDPFKRGEHSTGEVQIWADVSEADAKHIVRAVNNFAPLVDALRAITREFESTPNKNEVLVAYSLVEEARSAIANAERGQK